MAFGAFQLFAGGLGGGYWRGSGDGSRAGYLNFDLLVSVSVSVSALVTVFMLMLGLIMICGFGFGLMLGFMCGAGEG